MAKKYFKFLSEGPPIKAEQCTTAQPDKVQCKIPLGGDIDGTFHNVMIMSGSNKDLDDQANENIGKILEMTKEEANIVGQKIVPPDSTYIAESITLERYISKKFEEDGTALAENETLDVVLKAKPFDIDKEDVEFTEEIKVKLKEAKVEEEIIKET